MRRSVNFQCFSGVKQTQEVLEKSQRNAHKKCIELPEIVLCVSRSSTHYVVVCMGEYVCEFARCILCIPREGALLHNQLSGNSHTVSACETEGESEF